MDQFDRYFILHYTPGVKRTETRVWFHGKMLRRKTLVKN